MVCIAILHIYIYTFYQSEITNLFQQQQKQQQNALWRRFMGSEKSSIWVSIGFVDLFLLLYDTTVRKRPAVPTTRECYEVIVFPRWTPFLLVSTLSVIPSQQITRQAGIIN